MQRVISFAKSSKGTSLLGVGAGLIGFGGFAYANDALHPPSYPWSHSGNLSAYDTASIRRGHQVYQEVCASCHSLDRICFRNLEGVAYTKAELKKMAADVDVIDGPNDEGEMFERPGKLSDPLPRPYKNEEEARAMNAGAYPPDLSLIVKARHGGCDYVFAVLTGYRDLPAGVDEKPGLHYNPYFAGSFIAMPPPLMDDAVTYNDGTPATANQMAKDVSTFLAWAAEPEADDRKRMGMKFIAGLTLAALSAGYAKRLKWAPVKNRKITWMK
jgi:ubiquinol-cytochrome c reductase cytochrome c1 subunit